MRKFIIRGDFETHAWDSYYAKQYVYKHRNIFSKHITHKIIRNAPVIIKEIDTAPNGQKKYLFWCFYPDKIIVYEFNGKPNKRETKDLWENIREDTRGWYSERKIE